MRHVSFSSKMFSSYNFSPQGVSNSYLENDYQDGKLDEAGKTTLAWEAPSGINSTGNISATAFATVYDATGRTVTQTENFTIYPNKYFVGIKTSAYYVNTGEQVPFKFVAVDSRDKPIRSFPVEIQMIRHEWRSVLTKNSNGQYYYKSERQEVLEETKNLTIDGAPMSYSYRPKRSGRYEVRVRKRGEEDRYTSNTFYAYGHSSTTSSSFEVDPEVGLRSRLTRRLPAG